jgi:hypothetical protein
MYLNAPDIVRSSWLVGLVVRGSHESSPTAPAPDAHVDQLPAANTPLPRLVDTPNHTPDVFGLVEKCLRVSRRTKRRLQHASARRRADRN